MTTWPDRLACTVPEGTSGNVAVRRFEVEQHSLQNLREAMHGRATRPGWYTELTRDGQLWMSDTDAERRDHIGPALAIDEHGGRVLIGGLGLGCIVNWALTQPTDHPRVRPVEHIDVVEIDPDVVALVGPHYQKLAAERGVTLTIHQADMYAIRWRPGTRWNVAWFDIWPNLCTDDLADMARLRRSYGRRTDWNDCWGRQHLLRQRRQEQQQWWWR